MEEAGVSGYDLTWWVAAWLPAGAPPSVTARLNALFAAAIKTEQVTRYFGPIGMTPFVTTPDELMQFQIAEHEKWKRIVQTAGIDSQ